MKKNSYPHCSNTYWFGAFLLLALGCNTPPVGSFQLRSTNDLLAGTPIVVTLPDNLPCCEGLAVQPAGTEKELLIQAGSIGNAIFLLDAPLAANQPQQYTMVASSGQQENGLSLNQTTTGLDVMTDNQPLLTYNTATLSPQVGLPDYYRRSGFIHPFYSPDGKVLTDGFPIGHTHQHGIFFAWVNTTYRRDFTDFWNQQKETGTVAFRNLEEQAGGPIFAHFKSKHEHLSLTHGPVLEETWTVNTYHLPGYNIMDLTSRQKIIGTDTLFINKYHYGGMGIRLAAEWNEVDSSRYTGPMQLITGQGITDRDSANHSHPNWTAVYGKLPDGVAGIALLDHPSNFRFPQPVRVHPSMPYFVMAPMVESAFELVPGQEYVFNYRILSFDGEPDPEELEAMWQAYASEIKVEWDYPAGR